MGIQRGQKDQPPPRAHELPVWAKLRHGFRSDLNWLTYSCLLDFAKYLRNELIAMDMNPRDMIDVQSFMWCIAPGKYD
ncbi:hypothetical protein RW64_01645 [Geobacter sulfurreducens]|nr:hypothetical protein RW64_01645 [Geobacter sulfurreducens]